MPAAALAKISLGGPLPTVVQVHGAIADSSGWMT